MLNKGSNTELATPLTCSALLKEEITRGNLQGSRLPTHTSLNSYPIPKRPKLSMGILKGFKWLEARTSIIEETAPPAVT